MKPATSCRYAIGIDLGTTNCALSYVDLGRNDSSSRILEIPQWETTKRSVVKNILPSFAYYPGEADRLSALLDQWGEAPAVGTIALANAALFPGRVIHSAKSWLCHGGIDREAKVLPWSSTEIGTDRKCSPVEASALYLRYLRLTWDQQIAGNSPEREFDRQQVVVTVPASFGQDAQKLTLDAAEMAGYPKSVRLLEEPQAAFHAWIERHPNDLRRALSVGKEGGRRFVLVCDIGGGTTDLSLFSVTFDGDADPRIERIAVSEHILLGGDNIDLALAKRVESQLGGSESPLSANAWQSLVTQCRRLKELMLSEEGDEDKEYRITVAEEGAHLFTQTSTAVIRRSEIAELVNEGFFPPVDRNERPREGTVGLREMGLPYAKDTAITRYAAEFLSDCEADVDALLFNGGTLTPKYLRERIRSQITRWQDGREPGILENDELYLAVARGAAHFGKEFALKQRQLINAAASHGFYLEVNPGEGRTTSYVVCILPRGTNIEAPQRITKLDLRLLVNRPVSFRPYSSVRRTGDHPGQILKLNDHDFRPLPPLETFVRHETRRGETKEHFIPVYIEARLNALGLLRVDLVDAEKKRHARRWDLEFNLRKRNEDASEGGGAEGTESGEEAKPLPEELKVVVDEKLRSRFSLGLLRELESLLGRKKEKWNRLWLRALWEPLFDCITKRQTSQEYEAAWLNAAGYFLRPGYGVRLDDIRMEQLLNLHALGLAHPEAKMVREQYFIMWRRVSGGLDRKTQEEFYGEALPLLLSQTKKANEAFQMASSFEMLSQDCKRELFGLLIQGAQEKREKHCAPYLWSLGRLLSRVPMYAGEEAVVPPGFVEECFGVFGKWDWTAPNLRYMNTLFALACRRVESRTLDISSALREAVIEKMIASGAKGHLIGQVRDYQPVEREDVELLFGESLPAGLAVRFR